MKVLYIITLVSLLFGCTSSNVDSNKIATYIDGKIEKRLGDTVVVILGKEVDSITEMVYSEGEFYIDLRTQDIKRKGWHTFYNHDTIIQKVEYTVLQREISSPVEEIVSQYLKLKPNGDTIFSKSSYFKYSCNQPDTFNLADSLVVKVEIYHKENTIRPVSGYKLNVLNSQLNEMGKTVYGSPCLKYGFVPLDTGELNIDCHIYFFLPIEGVKDSLIQVEMFFDHSYNVIN